MLVTVFSSLPMEKQQIVKKYAEHKEGYLG